MRRWLPSLAVRRPVTVLMGFLALCVLGVISFLDIPLQMMPSGFAPPYMWVWVPNGDGTPSETDEQVVAPIQEHLSTVPGIKSMESNANTGSASFSLEFHQSVDLDEAYNAVADRMERAMPDLPEEVENYGIYRWDPDDEPVVWAGVSIADDLEDPHRLVNEIIIRKLERVPGVAKVDAWGVDAKMVFIDFDRKALFAHGISLYQVVQELGSDNFQMASGRLHDRGEVRYVRSLARYESLDELKRTRVAEGVTLGDIAEIHYRIEPSANIWHIDGKESAGLGINKESSANTVEVCQAINEAFRELDADPRLDGFGFNVFFDQGALIEESIDNLSITALQGGLFAVLILFLFLRELRMTLLIAASIPMSLVITVTVLYMTGGSLNLLSLMGLMIAVGMVVDNAIVVVETIYRRRQDGLSATEAAIEGTGEVNLAITLSTMTTMVVFLPLILMSEDAMFSFFMGSLGFPVVFALAASLLVALVFTPLTTVYLSETRVLKDPKWITWLAARYKRALAFVLARRFDMGFALALFTVLTVMGPVDAVGCTDQADGNLNDFSIDFKTPSTFGYYDRLEVLETYEALLDERRAEWEIRVHRARVRTSGRGSITVYLNDDVEDERREDIREEVLSSLPEIPGVEVRTKRGGESGEGANVVQLRIAGEDSRVLLDLADEVMRRARTLDSVLAAETVLEDEGSNEIQVGVDRDATARQGLNATVIGRTLAFAMRGTNLPDYHDGDKEVGMYARFRYEDRQDLDTLLDFPLWSEQTGAAVPLRSITDTQVARGFGSIHRNNGKISLPLKIEFEKDVGLFDALAQLNTVTADMEFPRGYGLEEGDRFDDQVQNDGARNMALLLSVTFVFLIMGVLFESYVLPMSIITTIPMALLGVFWTLWLSDTPLDVMGGVGLVILVGVVVNNGIVLIDLVTQLRRSGMERTEALVEAGERRMRPILMTALTTIFGLLPMALGSSTFIGIPYAPLARVVAGGIAAATLLTLFFVPFMYTCIDDLRGLSSRVLGWAWVDRSAPVEGK